MIAQATTKPLLSVRGLAKHYPVISKGVIRKQVGVIKACDDVNFDLAPGEVLGIVGESGSGKTTTGRAILRAIEPTAGTVEFTDGDRTIDLTKLHARHLKPLRTKLQMIFQDPFASLNPRMTVGQIVAEPLKIHRMCRGSELQDRVVSMLDRVGIRPEYRTRYPHAFSGGQRQRIGIARALIMNPRLVVCDEAVSALDVSVQAQVINLLADLKREFGLTYIFIAHDLSVVKHICDRVAVMYAGRIVELAPTQELFDDPKHPYTRMLLSAVPLPDPDKPMSLTTQGEPADLSNLPGGCAFHPRCPKCFQPCDHVRPKLLIVNDRVTTACHLYGETTDEHGRSATCRS